MNYVLHNNSASSSDHMKHRSGVLFESGSSQGFLLFIATAARGLLICDI